ncbi:MAG: hypothetical protein H5U37_05600 [Caldisericia bacterium]|nr:hypothetical protein [Caldisericia bacterium]
MERYESPTIEQVGGVGNHVEPQINIPYVFDIALAVVQILFAAFAIVYTVTIRIKNNP